LKLHRLRPIAQPFNVDLREGSLDLSGRVRYTNDKTVVVLDHLLLERANIDYMHMAETKEEERRRVKEGGRQAQQAQEEDSLQLTIKHGQVLRSEMGVINQAATPDYRVFMADMNVEMDNVSNRLSEGTGAVKVTGKFMGSGPTVVTGTFRPEKPTPDFDLQVKIIKTQLSTLNNVFRAHGKFDAHEGVFALFSDIQVKNGRVDGYVRPFLKDVEMYDPAKDRDKTRLNRAYQAVLGGIVKMLENQPRDEVATHANVSGPVDNPQTSTWQIVKHLVQNAFLKAIVPGMEG
jgi:hypothetical protein